MKIVQQIEEIGAFLAAPLKKGVMTNFFLSKDECLRLVEAGKMRICEGILLCGFDGYEKLYYAFEEMPKDLVLPSDLPIVVEMVTKDENSILPLCKVFSENGFLPHIKRKRMTSDKREDYDFDVQFADVSDIDYMFDVFCQNFDQYTSNIPSKEELLEIVSQKRIIKIAEDGETLGVLHFETQKGITSLRQLAVSETARGKGIGGRLVKGWRGVYHESPKLTFRLFVREDNLAAQGLYSKNGFVFDGLIAYSMIKENEKNG